MPTRSVASFAFALAFVFGAIHVSPSRRRSNAAEDRKSTRLNSSHEWRSYAVFCLKKKTEVGAQALRICASAELFEIMADVVHIAGQQSLGVGIGSRIDRLGQLDDEGAVVVNQNVE